jgi:CRP-like cAMP-binding protein
MTRPPPSSPPTAASGPVNLKTLAIFKSIAADTIERISQHSQKRTLDKGTFLFNVGDASDALYVVAEGRMRIWTVSAAGAEVTLNVLTKSAVFGEIGMLDGCDRSAGASAMTPTELISITRRTFFDAMDRDPQLARNVIELLCQRLRWISARMEDAALRQAPQRLARILGHLARDHGAPTPDGEGIAIAIQLTQGELAQWTAMSRESLNKTLNRWAEERLLNQSRGQLTILDLEQIDNIAEGGE